MPVAIADTSSAAASLLNGLNAAANQHAQLLQQQQRDQAAAAQRQLENELQLNAKGAIPAEVIGQGPNGMKTRTPNPSAAGEGQTVQEPYSGKKYYIPTDKEKGSSFVPAGGLADALKGAGWDGKSPITPEHSHSIMQALNEAQPKDEPYDVDTSGKFLDAQGNPRAAIIGKKSKTVKFLDMPDGGTFAPPEKAPKAPRTRVDLEHFSSPISVNEDTGDITPLKLPAGVKPQATPAQQDTAQRFREREADRQDARATRQEDQQQRGRDAAQKQIDIFNTKETEQHEKRAAYGQILSQANSKSKESKSQRVTVIDPDSKQEVELTPARRAYYQQKYQKATDLAGQYGQQSKKLITRHGGDTGSKANDPLGVR